MYKFVFLVNLAFFGGLGSTVAQAEEAGYPSKLVTIVVGTAPGSPSATMARLMADGLAQYWQRPVIVDHRTGASGTIAASAVAKSKPDGYTILLAASGPIGQMEVLRPNITPYRSLTDFRPVGLIAAAPVMVWVRKDLGIADLGQLVARAKAAPGRLTFGTGGAGTTGHLAMELLKVSANIDMLHIPYSSAVLAAEGFLGGQIDVLSIGAVGVFDPIEASGKATKLAVVSSQRYSRAPDTPTMAQAGYKEVNLDGWFGLMVPVATPDEIVNKIERDFLALMNEPEMRARIARVGVDVRPGDRDALKAMINADIEIGRRVNMAHIKID